MGHKTRFRAVSCQFGGLWNDAFQQEKRIAADKFEKNPVGMLRACLNGDPVTFAELALIAAGR